jgi:hypothetical protein
MVSSEMGAGKAACDYSEQHFANPPWQTLVCFARQALPCLSLLLAEL